MAVSDKKNDKKKADKKEQPKQGADKKSDAKKAAPDSKDEPSKEDEQPKEEIADVAQEPQEETGAFLLEQLKNCQEGEEVAVFVKLKKLSDYKSYVAQANEILKEKRK